MSGENLFQLFKSGGPVMFPLLACSLIAWGVILERAWSFRRLSRDLHAFHSRALGALLGVEKGKGADSLRALCAQSPLLPTSRVLAAAIERLDAADPRLRAKWPEAAERRRLLTNQELKQGLWILGTIGAASPFIGLFGTVIGILQAFHQIAATGSGGFTVVAAGISEALIATAFGIVVAVVAVLAYNAFQTRWAAVVLLLRVQSEELLETLAERI